MATGFSALDDINFILFIIKGREDNQRCPNFFLNDHDS